MSTEATSLTPFTTIAPIHHPPPTTIPCTPSPILHPFQPLSHLSVGGVEGQSSGNSNTGRIITHARLALAPAADESPLDTPPPADPLTL